jgi:transcriptional regulator with XRE-family HTH domain
MASTSTVRDRYSSEVLRLHGAGLSQRQIAARVGITRPMVQRIVNSADPSELSGSDDEVSEFRRELLEALDALWAENGNSFIKGGAVIPMLYRLENAETAFNAEYGLTGNHAVKAAKLRRMMAEGFLNG